MRSYVDVIRAPKVDRDQLGAFAKFVSQAEAALVPLATSGRIMKKNISWGRIGPKDYLLLQERARQMIMHANGMTFSLNAICSQSNAPASVYSRPYSGAPVPSEIFSTIPTLPKAIIKPITRNASFRSSSSDSLYEIPSGISEACRSTRTEMPDCGRSKSTSLSMGNLGESTHELAACCADALDQVSGWFDRVAHERLWHVHERSKNDLEMAIHDIQEIKGKLQEVLHEFWITKRFGFYL